MKEDSDIHEPVVAALRAYAAPGVVWWHTPNGGKRGRKAAAAMWRLGARAGVPDLVLVVHGTAYGLEFKTPRGRVSADQRAFFDEAVDAGVTIEVARSITEALSVLNSWGAVRLPADVFTKQKE